MKIKKQKLLYLNKVNQMTMDLQVGVDAMHIHSNENILTKYNAFSLRFFFQSVINYVVRKEAKIRTPIFTQTASIKVISGSQNIIYHVPTW